MTSPTTTLAANQQPGQVDLEALKARQQGAWSSGNYAIVGTTLQIVGEDLCEALDVRSGQKVLDVAAGNGNVTLAAARRWCNVVSTDYVPACSNTVESVPRPKACRSSTGMRMQRRWALPKLRSTWLFQPSASCLHQTRTRRP